MPVGVRTSGHTGEKNRHFHRQDMERRKSGMRVLGVTAGETATLPMGANMSARMVPMLPRQANELLRDKLGRTPSVGVVRLLFRGRQPVPFL